MVVKVVIVGYFLHPRSTSVYVCVCVYISDSADELTRVGRGMLRILSALIWMCTGVVVVVIVDGDGCDGKGVW